MTCDRPTWIDHFPGSFMWSNATLVTKGMAPYGAVALGEIDEVCERLRRRQDEPQAWWQEWSAMGARLERAGDAADTVKKELARAGYALAEEYRFLPNQYFLIFRPSGG